MAIEDIKDITDNNKDEKIGVLLEDLALLEGYARDLFSFLPLPISLVSSIGIILEINPAFEEISGYKIEEAVGKAVESIFEKDKIEELAKEVFKNDFVRAKEINLYTKDGRRAPVSVSASLRKSAEGEIIGYFIGFSDLSGVKKKEEELKEAHTALLNILEDSEEAGKRAVEERDKTRAIITNFADGLMILDENNKVASINFEAEKLLNVKAGEVEGQILDDLTGKYSIKELVELINAQKNKEALFRKEFSLKEPVERALEVTVISLAFLREKVIILHDISREKLIEKMKTEFVSLAAHQLRTPLSAIKWTLRMLLGGDFGKITDEQREFVEKIYKSNERMIFLVRDLLNVARIEEGRYLYKSTFAQIEDITQSVINSLEEEIKKKKIEFKFEKPEEKLPEVKVDAEKIGLAINNILDNAITYTPIGGKVTLSLKCGIKEMELSVTDTGIGILKEQQERIFTKFYRSAGAIKMEPDGSGLGLFIAKNIIDAHGGKIWFKSEQNKGSTFYVTIPIRAKFEEFLKEF